MYVYQAADSLQSFQYEVIDDFDTPVQNEDSGHDASSHAERSEKEYDLQENVSIDYSDFIGAFVFLVHLTLQKASSWQKIRFLLI